MYRDSGTGNLTIDLSGPDGNAFFLLGYAKDLCGQLGKNPDVVIEKMESGDYDNLVAVFEENFPVIDLINKPGE